MRRLVWLCLTCAACEATPEPIEPVEPTILPEGGEIRIEHTSLPMHIVPSGQFLSVRAFFLDTGTSTTSAPLPQLGECSTTMGLWPFSLPNPAVFADVGAQMRLAGRENGIILERQNNASGNFFRSGQRFDISYTPAGREVDNIMLEASYTLQLDGAEAPAPATIVLPAPIEATTTGTLTFTAGQNAVFEYRTGDFVLAPQDQIIVAIIDGAAGAFSTLCFSPPKNGKIAIPAAIVAQMTPKGLLAFGSYRHELSVWRGRRFDRVAINWNIATYEIR